MKILIKDVWQEVEPKDGVRILIEEKLPDGIDEYKAHADMWYKPVLPSAKTMEIIRGGADRWEEFETAYFKELDEDKDLWVDKIVELAKDGNVTLLYATDDPDFNVASALRDYLNCNEQRLMNKFSKAA